MLKIRNIFIVLGMLLCTAASADVQVSIGINVPVYPQLVVVPGYPVYYAPRLEANYFFYDGMYWVYQDDNWYSSSWYNGPWWFVGPEVVPLYILRIPVRYYRRPPVYFHGWWSDAPPRWGDHWGHDWEQRRSGWDRWNRSAVRAPAPLPAYQRQYSGDRYPRQVEQQHELHKQKYSYQPREPVVRERYQEQSTQKAPAQQERQAAPDDRGSRQQDNQRALPNQQAPQQGRPEVQDRRQSQQPELDQREQQMSKSQGRDKKQQGKDTAREPKRDQGQEQEQGRDRNNR